MPDFIVIITRPAEQRADVIEQRNLSVCVFAADHQNDAVQPDDCINEIGKAKLAVEKRENSDGEQRGRNFEKPGKIIVRLNRRPNQNAEQSDEQKNMKTTDGTVIFDHILTEANDCSLRIYNHLCRLSNWKPK